MSRAAFIKRLDELEARLLDAYVPPWRRFLESLSEEELEAMEGELDPGVACVHHGMADFVPGCDCLVRARALDPGGRSEVQYLALRLHRGKDPGSRSVEEPRLSNASVASHDREGASPAGDRLGAHVVQERPKKRREPRLRRSTDLPEPSPNRGKLWEIEVRRAEPGDVPGRRPGLWWI